MKNILVLLVINLTLFMWSFSIFLNKGIPAGTNNWRFYASLLGTLVFFTFVGIILLKIYRGVKNA